MDFIEIFEKRGLEWLKYILLAAVFTPLIYIPGFYFPFIVPKVIFFRVLVELAFVLFLILLARRAAPVQIGIFKNIYSWLPACLLLISAVASFFGIDPAHSFWSSFARMDGILTLLHVIIYTYLIGLIFNGEDWEKFFRWNIWIGGVVALVAVGQWLNIPGLVHSGIGRVEGTIGNAAFLAGYLIFSLFLAGRLAWKEKNKRWFYITISFVSFLAILLSQTRGTLISLVIVFAGGLFYVSVRGKKTIWRKRARIAVFLGVVLFSFSFLFRESLQKSSIPIVSRIASISLSDPTTKSRLFIWQETLKAVPDRLLFGVGMENFDYLYNKFYDPSVVSEEWFDRSHNAYLDELAQNGLVGFVVYGLLVGGALMLALRLFRRKTGEFFVLFLICAYFLQNFFLFDTLSTEFLFLSVYMFLLHSSEDWQFLSPGFIWSPLLYLFAVATVAFGWWFNIPSLRANLALADGYKYEVVNTPLSIEKLNRGLSYVNSKDLEYAYESYSGFIGKTEYGKLSSENMQKSYEYATSLLKETIKQYPWNVRLMVYLGHIIDLYPASPIKDKDSLVPLMDAAISLSPKRPQAYYLKANVFLRRANQTANIEDKHRNQDNAIKVIKQYATIVPNLAEPHLVLANALLARGEQTQAEASFKEGLRLYMPTEDMSKRVVTYLMSQSRFKETEPYFEDLVHAASTRGAHPEYAVDLVRIYYLNGKKDKAKELLLEIKKKTPSTLVNEEELMQTVLGN